MKMNINNHVKVKLTTYGKEILHRQFDEFHESYLSVFREFVLPNEDADGWSEWQMWYLMKTFGGYISLGRDVPFETEIEIVEGEL